MRPGQNKRMRGRSNNNNRKGPNPLTRSYESNGPDVKIRGTAHHVAEKYLQLARDAQSSGDPVMAESYLQHSEHYYRIIATAQLAQQQAQAGYQRSPGEADAEDAEDDDDDAIPDRFASPFEKFQPAPVAPVPGAGGQPPYQPQPQPNPYQGQPYGERPERQGGYNGGERQDRNQDRNQDRGPRPDRPFQDRNNRFNQNRQPRDGRPPRDFRGDRPDNRPDNRQDNRQDPRQDNRQDPRQDRGDRPERNDAPRNPDYVRNDAPRPEQRVMPEDAEQPSLPAFITAPVRIPGDDVPDTAPVHQTSPDADGDQEAGGFHLRPRRRRRRPLNEQGSEGGPAEPNGSGDLPFGE